MTLEAPLQRQLQLQITGDLLTDRFSCGRYATDASMYQMMPRGVIVPKNFQDVETTLDFARQNAISILPRGAGTSQCGQTVNESLVIDFTRHLNQLVSLDVDGQTCVVEPGIVLDELNRQLKPHGLWFPVDVSTASRATIGGMTANNSCGSRSIRYGLMRDNVLGIDALMANGEHLRFAQYDDNATNPLFESLHQLGLREADEIRNRFPDVLRRVGGYNIDALLPDKGPTALADLLVGSEGTLALSRTIELKLSPQPRHKLLGVCHFPSFHDAMDATQHLVTLGPVAVELIDRTMIELSRDIPMFRATVDQFVRGEPEAILLVEFAEDDASENHRRLKALGDLMADLGFSWDQPSLKPGGVVEAIDPGFQAAIFEVRKAGLNIMMSMRSDRKPISFVEDCAVELKDLAEYTARLTEIFEKHNTMGTWYAHASVGCLHVRPVLNLRQDSDIRAMRAIAEECFDMVLEYKGSHSGEHGDGLCRSEFHEKMFGRRMVDNFREIKNLFDPSGILNPGKIVDPPAMDDRSLFRFPPDYQVSEMATALNWNGWTGAGGGFQGAVEMCNNNGACRKLKGGAMCPSWRVTRDEKHLTRGRANSLRLAISGKLGEDALTSNEMREAMSLCVSCKACKRECPTGVDMARMKIEVNAARYQKYGASLHDRLVAELPRYAPLASKLSGLMNLRNSAPGVATLLESLTGFSRHRNLPWWHSTPYRHNQDSGPENGQPVVLFQDTFNTYFEPDNLAATREILNQLGYRVLALTQDSRPLCCGRTYLTKGLVDKAREEATRLIDTLFPFVERGIPIVGIEPSCVLSLRDELPAMTGDKRAQQIAEHSLLFEEFVVQNRITLPASSLMTKALVHGHCHQKAFGLMGPARSVLEQIPDLEVDIVESSCCGMAGSFGYEADHYQTSMNMAGLSLLPAIDASHSTTQVVANGFSCRHQINDLSSKQAVHSVQLIRKAIFNSSATQNQ